MKVFKAVLPVVLGIAMLIGAAYGLRKPPTAAQPSVTVPPTPAPVVISPPPPPARATAAAVPAPRGRFEESLARIEAMPVSAARIKRLKELLVEWARIDPRAVAAWTRTAPDEWKYTRPDGSTVYESARTVLRELLASVWASQDPVTAAAWVEPLAAEEGLNFRNSIAGAVAAEWVKLNGQAAAAWGLRLLEENRGFSVLESVFETWAVVNPREAADWLDRHSTLPDHPQRVASFAQEWARRDPRDAAAWAATLAPPVDRGDVLTTIGWMWSLYHPEAAATWAASLDPADRSDRIIRAVGEQLASKKPLLAMPWAIGFPEGPERTTALLATVAGWAPVDPQGAISFLHQLPSEPRRNEQMLNVGRALLHALPDAAPELLRRMQIPAGPFESRSEPYLDLLFERWSKVDPDAAVTWAKEASTKPGGKSLRKALERSASAASR